MRRNVVRLQGAARAHNRAKEEQANTALAKVTVNQMKRLLMGITEQFTTEREAVKDFLPRVVERIVLDTESLM